MRRSDHLEEARAALLLAADSCTAAAADPEGRAELAQALLLAARAIAALGRADQADHAGRSAARLLALSAAAARAYEPQPSPPARLAAATAAACPSCGASPGEPCASDALPGEVHGARLGAPLDGARAPRADHGPDPDPETLADGPGLPPQGTRGSPPLW